MARKRQIDWQGNSSRSRGSALPRDGGGDRHGDQPRQVRGEVPRSGVVSDAARASDRRDADKPIDEEGNGAKEMGMASRPVRLFLPEGRDDLSIYQRMIRDGAVKPFLMPDGIEKLAERVMRLMEIAEETGRYRDAMKAAEILRGLVSDNRALAVELDKIERLDAGKPTSISGQVDAEVAARIKKIVSTQRARANTEKDHGRGTNDAGDRGGDDRGGDGKIAEAGADGDSRQGDHQAAEASRGAGAEDPPAGGQV